MASRRINIIESTTYLQNLTKQDVETVRLVEKKVIIFRKDPKHRVLRNHKLKGKMRDKYSFSFAKDIRIVYKWQSKKTVRFLAIGSHKQVYTK